MVTVPLPPLADEDIGAILAAGEAKTGLRFDDAARRSIVDLAQGLPYPAHLLALFATHSAAARQSRRVETQDLRDAARRIGDDPTFLLKIAYDRALGDEPGDETEDLLFFAARSRTNVTGTFDAAAIAAAAAAGQKDGAGNAVTRLSLLSLHHALDGLTEPDRGPVLCRVAGLIEPAYRFTSEMMRAYVLIRQAERRGLI